jgi:hypothetical protein
MTREEAIKICKKIDASAEIRFKHPEVEEAFNMAIEALEQEPILDKIRSEIEELSSYVARFNGGDFAIHIDKEKVLEIIDKCKAESEDECQL